jgi:hypothetical protein
MARAFQGRDALPSSKGLMMDPRYQELMRVVTIVFIAGVVALSCEFTIKTVSILINEANALG